MDKRLIIKKTMEVGITTLASRFLGLARELLLGRYIGVDIVADAFTTAFMLPNSLRKIFAEGALTSAFVPTFITVAKKEGLEKANALTTIVFLVFESVLLIVCALVMWKAHLTVTCIMPGFSSAQIEATVPLLRILMPFVFFISVSALLSGPLQSVNHFFVPAAGPVLLNFVFLGTLIAYHTFSWPIEYFCYGVLIGGFLQCITHIVTYFKLGFSFAVPDKTIMQAFYGIVSKFIFCFFSMSVIEIGLFMDLGFASYLSVGSVTMLKYASRLMGIPLGVFAVAFSTILLPHFTKTRLDNPEKMSFYGIESAKFIIWVTLPATLLLSFFAKDIFLTLFVSGGSKFPVERVPEAAFILVGYLIGLCFFSLNKIFFSIFFSLHDTFYPTVVSIIGTAINFVANYYLINAWGGFGLALATTISGIVQTVFCFYFLHSKHAFELHLGQLIEYCVRYVVQTLIVLYGMFFLYSSLRTTIAQTSSAHFFIESFGFWLWVGPLIIMCYGLLYVSRTIFRTTFYFID